MFTLAKDTADISAKYYSVVMKVKKTDNTTVKKDNVKKDNALVKKKSSKMSSKDKVSWVPIKLPGRKPTKVYRRTDSNRNSLQGK